MEKPDKLFIAGCGYIGRRIALLAKTKGYRISALVRSPEKISDIVNAGIQTVTANMDDSSSLMGLPIAGATVIYLIPPPGGGVTDPRVRNFCRAVPAGSEPAKIVYISTSGVYGNCGDIPVTEDFVPAPETTRGKRRLDAEKTFQEWGKERGVPIIILRVTGIYGPGRLPLQHLTAGTPLLLESEAPVTNRIHADDLATICLAAAEHGVDGEIYNISDGEHTTMTHYFNSIADLLGIERPRQVDREEASQLMPPLLYSYFSENRRIDNSKMLKIPGVTLKYPTLAEGLPSCKPSDWRYPGKQGS